MKHWIKSLLIKPNSVSYQTFYFINNHRIFCLLIMTVMIISYPLLKYSHTRWHINQQQNNQNTLLAKVEKQKKLFSSLQQHIQTHQKNNVQFTQINQQIRTILDKYQAKAEQWQWRLEQENQLHLRVNHHSQDLFNILHEINQISNLYCKELSLTKLHYAHLVQLSGLFILSNKGK